MLIVNGWTISKLPDHCDFQYAVAKNGFEEKFYSLYVAKAFAEKH